MNHLAGQINSLHANSNKNGLFPVMKELEHDVNDSYFTKISMIKTNANAPQRRRAKNKSDPPMNSNPPTDIQKSYNIGVEKMMDMANVCG